jgi:MFS-type transporter involved in bile tolerance (Atg22 family)
MLSPLVKFLGAPLLSGLADHTRQHRIILYVCLSLSVLFRFSLVFVRNGFPTCAIFVVLAETLGSVGSPIFENGVLELLPVGHEHAVAV